MKNTKHCIYNHKTAVFNLLFIDFNNANNWMHKLEIRIFTLTLRYRSFSLGVVSLAFTKLRTAVRAAGRDKTKNITATVKTVRGFMDIRGITIPTFAFLLTTGCQFHLVSVGKRHSLLAHSSFVC